MKFYADFHIHSRYSRATSSRLVPENLDRWAQVKGLALLGTGDFTHPGWFSELKEKLIPAEEGLYILSPEARRRAAQDPQTASIPLPPQVEGLEVPEQTRFILSAEISTIYSWGGRVRKVHHVILAPSFQAASRIQDRLGRIGNLASDGRPILGLDSRDLLEILLEADPSCVLIPAHIWTPWFSVLGSKSGFDSIREAYRDLSGHVFAIETGLSSDPPMNWLCAELDAYAILSNSDAHSPENLAREANKFDTELSYPAIVAALREAAGQEKDRTIPYQGKVPPAQGTAGLPNGKGREVIHGFLGTIEFFPQEGKYHFDGHRKCGVVMNPIETAKHGGLCPGCGKPLTVGVMNRVISLADRVKLEDRPRRKDFLSLIPLKEILSELMGMGTGSRALETRYHELIEKGGPELWLLTEAPFERIAGIGGLALAEGIQRMRERRVVVQEGYDGEYGHVWVFGVGGISEATLESSLFPDFPRGKGEGEILKPRGLLDFDIRDLSALKEATQLKKAPPQNQNQNLKQCPGRASYLEGTSHHEEAAVAVPLSNPSEATQIGDSAVPSSMSLNEDQRKAVEHEGGLLLILAGPGTGKTNTLTHRIAHFLKSGIPPENILALTFTRKAAAEMRNRLGRILEEMGDLQSEENVGAQESLKNLAQRVKICTFHSFGLDILREFHPRFGRSEHFVLLSEPDRERILKNLAPKGEKIEESHELRKRYKEFLKEIDAFDLDDLSCLPVALLEENPEVRAEFRTRYTHLFVDEYQDVNEPQYRLLRLLAPDAGAHLTVIGDPDQAIYGFRGAHVGFIRRFTSDYPTATVLSLSTSYRCPPVVLKAAQEVIDSGTVPGRMPPKHDRETRKGLGLVSGLSSDMKIQISQHPSDAAEAEFISRTIENLTGGFRFFSMDSGVSDGAYGEHDPGEIAVLCRTTRQMECLEKAFHDHAIPYIKVGERSFLQEEPVASLLNIARFLTSPRNAYFKRIVSQRIQELFHRNWITAPLSTEDLARKGKRGLPSRNLPARRVLDNLMEALGFTESIRRSFDVERLLSLAEPHSLSEFLYGVATRSSQDDLPYRTSRVTLSTIHGVKGLEFACVFITGCEEGLLPYTPHTLFPDPRKPAGPEEPGPRETDPRRAKENRGALTSKGDGSTPRETGRHAYTEASGCRGISRFGDYPIETGRRVDIEEERRLFYVGMTRAKRYLHLSWAARRFLFGREYRLGPSSFLLSIEEALLKRVDPEYKKHPLDRQLSLF